MSKTLDYATRNDFKKLDSKLTKYKDEILNGLDEVMGELQAMREDNTIGIHQTRVLREDVDNHEKRITKLESTTS